MKRFSILVLLFIFTTSCAEVEIRPLKIEERMIDGMKGAKYDETKGVRFFQPWPYLAITAGDKGGCKMDVVYLPQLEQEYIIIPHTGIGTVTMAPTLTNGWALTSLNTVADSKASEMVNAIGNLTGNAAKASGKNVLAKPENENEYGPGIYRIVFDHEGFVSDLKPVFLQKGSGANPAKCSDIPPSGGGRMRSAE